MGGEPQGKNQEEITDMTESERELLYSIKKDNGALFKRLVSARRGLLSLSYGRFPVLSLCYLYNSKKIIADYEEILGKIDNYNVIDEDYESYRRFKKLAGRAIRLYANKAEPISPQEVLAVTDDVGRLKDNYGTFAQTERVRNNLSDVFRLKYEETVVQENGTIKCHKSKLGKLRLTVITVVVLIAFAFVGISCGIWKGLTNTFGDGSENAPINVFSGEQLLNFFSRGSGSVNIKNDIVIDTSFLEAVDNTFDFGGTIDGGGYTLELYGGEELFNTFSGTLKNITIKVAESSVSVARNAGFLFYTNQGTLNDVTFEFTGDLSETAVNAEEGKTSTAYFGLLSAFNYGIIKNCSATCNITLSGNGEGDAYFGTFAGFNSGTVDNCVLKEGSSIVADTVDVGSLVGNNYGGTVSNCSSNAAISQTTDFSGWSPSMGGIASVNYGNISYCVNYGNIIADFNGKGTRCVPHVGGISAYSFGAIANCKNTGNIEVAASEDVHTYIYVGGITGELNTVTNSYGTINSSYNSGAITAKSSYEGTVTDATTSKESTLENLLFVGGVVGYSLGMVKSCGNVGKIESDYYDPSDAEGAVTTDKFRGAVIAAIYYPNTVQAGFAVISENSVAYLKNLYSDNYFLPDCNCTNGTAVVIATVFYPTELAYKNEYSYNETADLGASGVGTLEELRTLGVYW